MSMPISCVQRLTVETTSNRITIGEWQPYKLEAQASESTAQLIYVEGYEHCLKAKRMSRAIGFVGFGPGAPGPSERN